jgi:pyruvate dehydrogenase E1 component beta subunit
MVACIISDKAFDYLDAPVKRLTSIDSPAIYSPPLEKLQLPTVDRIYQAALDTLK